MPHPLASDLDDILERTRELWGELRGRRIFVTGATGFVGCWLLESFAWANRRLELHASATILSRNPDRLKERVPHLAGGDIEVITGDVCNFAFPSRDISHVIHAAADSSAQLNASQPDVMFNTIVDGTRRCLDFAMSAGAGTYLFVSSGAVYGKQPAELSHVTEDFTGAPDQLDTASAYAEGKRAAELLCAIAAKRSDLRVKIARGFAFVGPYMKLDAHFAIGNFIRDHLEGIPIRVRGDGTPLRSYMYASDLMVWLWTILLRGESARAYNVGSEEGISIAELAREVAAAGPESAAVQIMGTPAPSVPIARYVPSTARAQRELGLRCTVPLRAAIERTLEWNRSGCPRELQSR